jgi:hypothetical protein
MCPAVLIGDEVREKLELSPGLLKVRGKASREQRLELIPCPRSDEGAADLGSAARTPHSTGREIETTDVGVAHRRLAVHARIQLRGVAQSHHDSPPLGEHHGQEVSPLGPIQAGQAPVEPSEEIFVGSRPGILEDELGKDGGPGKADHVRPEAAPPRLRSELPKRLEVARFLHPDRQQASRERLQAGSCPSTGSADTFRHDTHEPDVAGVEAENPARLRIVV